MSPRRRLGLRVLLPLAAAVGSVLTACVEDPLALDAGSAPGASEETVDVSLLASELGFWRDTTLSGFALRNEAAFQLISNRPDRVARALGRLDVPDTISTFADTLPVAEFSNVDLRMSIDTVRSEFDAFPVTVRMVELTRPFDPDSVTWLQAGPSEPWTMPGGDLGVEIATGELPALADSVILTLSVSGDSLMKAWQESDGQNGFAFLLEGPDATIDLRQVVVRYEALLEGRESPVDRTQFLDVRTFINDPPPPPAGTRLRVGGLPSSRFYLDFEVPAEIDGIPLDETVINHAEVRFVPLVAPDEPYVLERDLAARQVKLLEDPFVYFEKTPIGTSPLRFTALVPDSLVAGRPVRLDVTLLVVDAIRGETSRIRLGFRGEPDAQALGFWDFGSIESVPEFQPRLRIVFTPRPTFEVPR